MKKALFAVFFCLSAGLVLAQVNGAYRSRQTGDWNQATTWEVFNSGGWNNLESPGAGIYQNVTPTAASDVITISSNTTATVPNGFTVTANQIEFGATTATLQVATGGTLIVNNGLGHDVRLFNDGISFSQLLVGGTFRLNSNATIVNDNYAGTVVAASQPTTVNTYKVLDGGVHIHNSNNALPYADWQTGSTFRYRATNINPTIANPSIQFYNFIWDGLNQTQNLILAGRLRNVNGDFTVIGTNGRTLHLSTIKNYTLNIGGNLAVSGNSRIYFINSATATLNISGNFQVSSGSVFCSVNGTTTVNISGDLLISGGILNLRTQSTAGGGGATNLNIIGNYSHTAGTLTRTSGGGFGNVNFTGGGTSTLTKSGSATINNSVNFAVANGKTLDIGTSFITGTGSITLFNGSTLHVKSLAAGGAIQNNTTGGNIRVSGTRTYQIGSTIIYNGVGAQFMGAGHPSTVHTIIDNPSSVTLVSNVTTRNLTISDGIFDVGANNTVRIDGNFIVNDPFEGREGLVRFGGASPQTISGASPVTFFNMEVNQTASSTLIISTNVSIENNLSINSGSTLNAGTELLTLLSSPTRTANVNSLATTGASIVGSVIVQRHLPKAAVRSDFHHMASPVTNAKFTDWQPEIDILSAFTYSEPIRDFSPVPSFSSDIVNGRGYALDIGGTGSFDIDTRGTLRQGDVEITVTSQDPTIESADGFNLIGNPYASAIDWDNITLPAGVYDAVYTTDNFNNSGQETGINGTTHAVTYVDGLGTPASYGGTIAQGQAFWVKAVASSVTLTITESAKISATNTQFYREQEIPNVLRITLNGEQVKDETVVRLREGATDAFDGKYDAYKFLKGDISISTLTSDKVQAVINAYGFQECERVIPLVGEGITKGSYTLDFVGMESFDEGINIALRDLFENQTIDVRNQQSYTFDVTDENSASFSSRFEIIIGNSTANTELLAIGETLCEDKDVAIVTIEKSEPGIQYTAEWKGEIISEPLTGTGAALQLVVNTSQLDLGENALTIRAQSGNCSMAALSEKPVVTKIKKSEITVVQTGNICNSGTATLIASGAMENGWYHWYEDKNSSEPIAGQQSAEFTTPYLTKTKTYYVAAVNAAGCEGNRVQVSANVSHMEIEEVDLTVEGSTLVSSAQENNQWYFNDEQLVNETSNRLEASASGMYTVMVTQGNCTMTDSKEISLSEEEGLLDADLNIYPNPTQHKLFIKVKTTNSNVSATMVNASGNQMESKTLVGENGVKEAEFDLLPYASGIYNVRIVDGHKVFIKKIVKIK